MSNESLSELRKRIKQRERDVSRKVRRIESPASPKNAALPHGVKPPQVSGTKYDPRRPGADTGRYTRKQAEAYLSSLDTFMSRRTQFVPLGRNGTPLPAQKWGGYKGNEKRFNRKKLSKAASAKDIPITALPGHPTVEQRAKAVIKEGARNSPVTNPWEGVRREPYYLTGVKAFEKLNRDMAKRNTKEWEDKQYRKQLKFVRKALRMAKEKGMLKDVEKLTRDQFYFLFNLTPFASDISEKYEVLKATDAQQGDEESAMIALEEARDHIDIAKGIKRLGS